eukprot:g3329.t1
MIGKTVERLRVPDETVDALAFSKKHRLLAVLSRPTGSVCATTCRLYRHEENAVAATKDGDDNTNRLTLVHTIDLKKKDGSSETMYSFVDVSFVDDYLLVVPLAPHPLRAFDAAKMRPCNAFERLRKAWCAEVKGEGSKEVLELRSHERCILTKPLPTIRVPRAAKKPRGNETESAAAKP